jgi:TPR repeat protein
LIDGRGVEEDLEEAARYYRLSASEENALGQWLYGSWRALGKGVDVNLAAAVGYDRLIRGSRGF